jgi:nicotinamide mononucleotide transporter
VSTVEILAALLGLIAVALVVRRSVWNYPFGIASVLLSIEVFYGAKLYSDALLQLYFFAMQLYGWKNWLHHRDQSGYAVVEALDRRGWIITVGSVCAITAALGFAMSSYTDAALPWWDASIAGLSVVAQILMAQRKFEQWLLWIPTNSLAVAVYFNRELYAMTGLYAVLLVIAIIGWRAWRAQLQAID